MKHIWYSLAIFMLLIASCTPIDEKSSLGPLLTASDIHLDVHNITSGSNKIVMINNTPNVGGMWYYGINTSIQQKDTIMLPFLGNTTIYFYATTAGGIVKDSVIVNVTKIDYPTAPQWEYLAGSGTSGKTWVWATDVLPPSKYPNFPSGQCFGPGGYLASEFEAPNWSTHGLSDLTKWGVANDQMIFDLNGGANYTLVTGNTSVGGLPAGTYHGTFSFDMSKTLVGDNPPNLWSIGQLTLTGATVSKGFNADNNNALIYTYDILMLNDDEMILASPDPEAASAWDTAWFWIFKRKGYSFAH